MLMLVFLEFENLLFRLRSNAIDQFSQNNILLYRICNVRSERFRMLRKEKPRDL
jgi:hypothetical protein